MADENLISIASIEDSPDVVIQNPAIEIGYLTSITHVDAVEITVQNPVIEIGYLSSITSVEGMPDEMKRNFLCNGTVSPQNQTKQTGIYIDRGFVFIPAQPNMPNNQTH